MSRPLACAGLLSICLLRSVSAAVTVAQDGSGDFNGKNGDAVIEAVQKLRAVGGGEVFIRKGIYEFPKGLRLIDVRNIHFRGEPGTVLKLLALQHAETSAAAAAGVTKLPVKFARGLVPGMRIRVLAPGELDKFSGRNKPTFFVRLASVSDGALLLAEPLPFPAPAGTAIMNEDGPNLFEIRGKSSDITFSHLTLDGGRGPNDPPVLGHAQLCGVFASGPYSYSDGPTGPRVSGIHVRHCTIRNFFGRAVAFYSVESSSVTNCRIEDIVDEGIDFDHFTVGCSAVDNEIRRTRVAVELNDANESRIANNRISECPVGVNLWRWCKLEDLNVRNIIAENIFTGISGTSILIKEDTSLNVVRGNMIVNSKNNGITIAGKANRVADNLIQRPGAAGIFVSGDENEILANHVVNASAAEPRKADGIHISGSRNRVLDNYVRSTSPTPTYREPVSDKGRDNMLR